MRALAQHPPGARPAPSKPLSSRRLDGLVFEQIAGEPPRGGGDDDGVRRRGRLQPRREVRRLADDVALLRLAGADQFADDDQAGGDADADLVAAVGDDSCATASISASAGAHRIFGVGLAGLGIAEIDQHAVAHIFGDIAAEAGDHLGGAFVVGGDDLAQIFRIEPGRERGRADQIAEHHRELAALGGMRRARGGRRAVQRRRQPAAARRAASPSLVAALRAEARTRAHWRGRKRRSSAPAACRIAGKSGFAGNSLRSSGRLWLFAMADHISAAATAVGA